jgi:hypothetical protein
MRFTAFLYAFAFLVSTVGAAQGPGSMPAPGSAAQTSHQATPQPAAPQQPGEPGLGARPAAQPAQPDQVAPGTEIQATLDTALSSRTSQPGDRFTATIVQPVRAADGSVAIPAGARIQGEVGQVEEGKTLPAVRGGARLNMRFHEVVLPDGRVAPLTATLLSVHDTKGAQRAQTDEEGEVRGRTRGEDVARDVGIGAAVGTVAGILFGKTLRGLAIGAAAGGGYVLATRGKDVDLTEQTGLRLRVDQAISPPQHQAPAR